MKLYVDEPITDPAVLSTKYGGAVKNGITSLYFDYVSLVTAYDFKLAVGDAVETPSKELRVNATLTQDDRKFYGCLVRKLLDYIVPVTGSKIVLHCDAMGRVQRLCFGNEISLICSA